MSGDAASADQDAVQALIERWVPARLRALSAYHVADADNLVKLDAMENPWPWPAALVDDWLAALRDVELNRYPSADASALKADLAAHLGVPEGAQLVLGNGSDELIALVATLVAGPGRVLLTPDPGFSMYRQIATVLDLEFVGVPLAEDFSLPLGTFCAAIEKHQPALVFLAVPNNPTGNLFDADAVRAVLEAAPGIVVVDEAYGPFSDATFLDQVGQWPNLMVMRTLSKAGFAGLRLGLMAAPPAWATELEKLRLPYNINTLTQASARFALANYAAFDEQVDAIRRERGQLAQALSARAELTLYPSAANFVLVRCPQGTGPAVFAGMRDRGVLVKNLHGAGTGLADCLRITVGSAAENATMLDALDGALAAATGQGSA